MHFHCRKRHYNNVGIVQHLQNQLGFGIIHVLKGTQNSNLIDLTSGCRL